MGRRGLGHEGRRGSKGGLRDGKGSGGMDGLRDGKDDGSMGDGVCRTIQCRAFQRKCGDQFAPGSEPSGQPILV